MPVVPNSVAPVLHVSDIEKALTYYTEVLGFTEEFRFEDRYAGVRSGEVQFHLSLNGGEHNRPVGGSSVYLFLSSPADVDTYYAEITARGARTSQPPQNYPYGMRDFAAFDLDGNVLGFGASTETDE